MTIFVLYDDNGKCQGYFLQGEENLAKLWVRNNGGRYEKKTV